MLMQSRAELSNGDGMMPMAILIIVKIPNNSSAVMNSTDSDYAQDYGRCQEQDLIIKRIMITRSSWLNCAIRGDKAAY